MELMDALDKKLRTMLSGVYYYIDKEIYSDVMEKASDIPYTDVKTIEDKNRLENEFMAIATKKLAEEQAKIAEKKRRYSEYSEREEFINSHRSKSKKCPPCSLLGGRSYKYKYRNMRKSRRNMRKSRRKSRK
jgi:hypothetical protein